MKFHRVAKKSWVLKSDESKQEAAWVFIAKSAKAGRV